MYFDDFTYSIESNLVEFPLHMVIVYFNLYYLIPKLLPGKVYRYLGALTFSVIIVAVVRMLVTYDLVTTEVWKEASKPGLQVFDINYLIAVIVGELYVVGFTMAIKLGIDWMKSTRKTKELENKSLEAELSYLRSQLHPHFFFNTLNNLYALTLAKSNEAPETVLKLSDLMSYIIYKGKSKYVSLMSEINHIQDYLDLEKLRYGKKLDVDITITESIEDKYIPPLLLLPFLENAFKHGGMVDRKLPISISIEVNELTLIFTVKNHLKGVYDKESKINGESQGIGIKNTLRRLDILYSNTYSLKVDEENNEHKIILSVPVYDKMPDHRR